MWKFSHRALAQQLLPAAQTLGGKMGKAERLLRMCLRGESAGQVHCDIFQKCGRNRPKWLLAWRAGSQVEGVLFSKGTSNLLRKEGWCPAPPCVVWVLPPAVPVQCKWSVRWSSMHRLEPSTPCTCPSLPRLCFPGSSHIGLYPVP